MKESEKKGNNRFHKSKNGLSRAEPSSRDVSKANTAVQDKRFTQNWSFWSLETDIE